MIKRSWLLGGAGGLLVVALGAGAVMAQTPGAGAGSTFLDRVAQKLGVDTPKLQKAITDTRNEDIDAAVANGDLTQKQADALKQKLQDSPKGFGEHPFGDRAFGGPKGFGPIFGFGPGFGLADAPQQLADFLGITTDQLMTELKAENATLATVAQARGKSRDDLKTFITDKAKSKLDDAVKNGDLTQKNEDAMLAKLNASLDKIIDGKFGMFFRGLGRHRGMPDGDGDDTPKTPTAPQSGSGTGSSTQSF